ncbi:MAG: hypothetical protein EOP09_06790, partial [Proteobacteria bacterium]
MRLPNAHPFLKSFSFRPLLTAFSLSLLCFLVNEAVSAWISWANELHQHFSPLLFLLPVIAALSLQVDSQDRLRLPPLRSLISAEGRSSHVARARKLGPLILFLVFVFMSHAVGASVGREGVVLLVSVFIFLALRNETGALDSEIAWLMGGAFAAATHNVFA